jgi:MYXO-CTERM domain-containing protein
MMQQDSGEVDATAEGGGDAGSGQSGQNSGCGCKVAQAEDGPSSTLLAFGGLGLAGAIRLRRRKKS